MAQSNSPLRFDHREIAVIFSLFVFVSLLMFTVGIMVGKGLAQAKYEGVLSTVGHTDRAPTAVHPDEAANHEAPTGSSVSTPEHDAHGGGEAAAHSAHGEDTAHQAHGDAHPSLEEVDPTPAKKPLELVPKQTKTGDVRGSLQDSESAKELRGAMKSSKVNGLFEAEPGSAKRKPASQHDPFPKSLADGKFTVQVGAYSKQQEAMERVENLKKLGFPFAYFSANQRENKETWYRVWLGYYPDKESATRSGDILQAKGEVKNYIVRKTDSDISKDR